MNELLAYTSSRPDGARKYTGDVATGYDAKRMSSPKWAAEQKLIQNALERIPDGSKVMDCPVGTGRFLSYYAGRNFLVHGFDVSGEMLDISSDKIGGTDAATWCVLQCADVRELPCDDDTFDASVMCRLTRWLSPEDRVLALKELQRVTKSRIIITARVANHPYAYPYAEIEGALDGWEIAEDHECGEPDYRVIVLEPVD